MSMLSGLLFEEIQEPKKVTIHYNDGEKERVTVTAFQYCKKAKCDFIAFTNEDGKVCISRVKNTDKDFLLSDDFTDEQFEMMKKQLFAGKGKDYNFSMIPAVINEEDITLKKEEEKEEKLDYSSIIKTSKEDEEEFIDEDEIIELPIYYDEDGNYYEDKWGVIKYTDKEVDEMFNDPKFAMIEKPVVPSIFNIKRKKVIYVDEEGYCYKDKYGKKPLSQELLDKYDNDEHLEVVEQPIKAEMPLIRKRIEGVAKVLTSKNKTAAIVSAFMNQKRKKVIYVDEEGFCFKDKYGKKPISEEELERIDNDKHLEVVEQPVKTRVPLIRNTVDVYIVGDNYYLEKECQRPLKKEIAARLYENPKNKIVEHRKEEIIVYVDQKTAKCFLDPSGIRKISRDKLDEYEFSKDYVVRYQTLEKKKLKKRITVYVDQRGTIYAEPEAKRVINKEKLDALRLKDDVVIIEEQIRVNKKTPLTIYVDEEGRTYFDKEGKTLIEPSKVALLEENKDIILNRVPIKKVVKKVVVTPKVVEVKTENKKEAPVELPKVVELPAKKDEVKERVIFVSNGEYYWDSAATMKMTAEEYKTLKESPKYNVVEKAVTKNIVLVFRSNGRYYYDSACVNEITAEQLEELKSKPQVDLVINEIERKKVTIYKSGEDYYHDEYKLTPYSKEEIVNLSQNPLYQMNIVNIVEKKRISDYTEEELRSRMAQILNVSDSVDVLKANEHEISYQLDDWEIDEFQELRSELKGRSR